MTFPDLLESALAGTQNHAPATDNGAAEDGAMSPERRIMRGASIDGLRWLAGRPLERPEPAAVLEPAGPEHLPEVSQAAAARLVDILQRRSEALAEWLRLVWERRFRVPPILLPELLEYGRTEGVVERSLILDVGGQRMVWLAKLNSSWTYAAHADADDQFASGSGEDRVVALHRIRRRDPAQARKLLETVWESERGDLRAGLLATLGHRLSLQDETMLVQALRDRRREVREVALRLLRGLPDSGWAARWTDRAGLCIQITGGDLVVRELGSADPNWVTDGLDAHPPNGVGSTAWLLRQVVALTPPRIWPGELLHAILRSDWRTPLLAGLAEAAAAYGDAYWCSELLLASQPGTDARPLFRALSETQAVEIVRRLFELVTQSRNHQATIATLLREAAWHFDPGAAPLVEAWLDGDAVPIFMRPALVRLDDTLDYRVAMRRELER
jgi:hypothetical protein